MRAALRKGLVLASFTEQNVRIAFLRQVQVNHRWRDICQIITAIEGQLNFVFTLKFLKFFTSVDSTQRAVATFTDS